MHLKNRLQQIGRDDYQSFLAQISDAWTCQAKLANGFSTTFCVDNTLSDLQDDFEHYSPTIKDNVAYFACKKRFNEGGWIISKIGIPVKVWFRFMRKPKTTFVDYRIIV